MSTVADNFETKANLTVDGAEAVAGTETIAGNLSLAGSFTGTGTGTLRSFIISLGVLSATAAFSIPLPNLPGTIVGVRFVTVTAITANDTNFWTFGLVDDGPAGTGTAAPVDATVAANSTKATGGVSLVANVPLALTPNTTPANNNTLAKDVLTFTATKSSAATTMNQCSIIIELQPTG